jgi:hypothetical protein
VGQPTTRSRVWSGVEQGGELLGVDLGVVAVAVVEQDMGLLGFTGKGGHLERPDHLRSPSMS